MKKIQNFLEKLAPLPSPAQMHEWDAMSIGLGIPGLMLMENASSAALAVLEQVIIAALPGRENFAGVNIWLFMGSGNNGGDAACLARHLLDVGAKPLVVHTAALGRCRGDTARHVRMARAAGVEFVPVARHNWDVEPGKQPEIIVDGLLGTGFSGQLRPEMEKLVRRINALGQKALVFSLDIPSGLDGNTGLACPVAVRATATVSFAAAKPGLVLPQARQWTGDLYVRTIGIPKKVSQSAPCSTWLVDGRCLDSRPELPADSHKNSFGHVLVIGGAAGMAGAAHLSARAALRSGAGLVTVAAPATSLADVRMSFPEIMTARAGEDKWPDMVTPELDAAIARASALVIGPGMGRDQAAATFLASLLALRQSRSSCLPLVLDADALVLLAAAPALYASLTAADILTPHPGEAATMLGCQTTAIQEDRTGSLSRLCQLSPATVILKGAGCLIGQGNGPVLICPYDLPQLAVAGSGDVLSGCLGALWARQTTKGMDSLGGSGLEIACKAVVSHAVAGMICAERFPQRGNLASQVADNLPMIYKWLADRGKPGDLLPWPYLMGH